MIQVLRSRNYRPLLVAIIFSVVVFTLGVVVKSATAQQSKIDVTICSSQPPIITVASPVAGVVLHTNTVAIEGFVENASSIVVRVNASEVAEFPVQSSGPFSATASLLKGDNTIEIIASRACNDTQHTESIAVHYDPDTPAPPAPEDPRSTEGAVSSEASWPGSSILQRIKDNLSGISSDSDREAPPVSDPVVDTSKVPLSYAVAVRSWFSLLFASGAILFLLLPKRVYNRSKWFYGYEKRILLARLVAGILALLFLFIVQI